MAGWLQVQENSYNVKVQSLVNAVKSKGKMVQYIIIESIFLNTFNPKHLISTIFKNFRSLFAYQFLGYAREVIGIIVSI
jgi:hypothetical protein